MTQPFESVDVLIIGPTAICTPTAMASNILYHAD